MSFIEKIIFKIKFIFAKKYMTYDLGTECNVFMFWKNVNGVRYCVKTETVVKKEDDTIDSLKYAINSILNKGE